MPINYLKQKFFLNSIFALVLIWFLNAIEFLGPEGLMIFAALPGFVVGFFIKENSLIYYIKSLFLNSLFFGFLATLIFTFYIAVFNLNSFFEIGSPIFPFLLFFLFGACNFFGGLVSIVPKSFIERSEINK